VAVDANAWWCNGPVSLAIAELHAARGDLAGANRMLRLAQPIARTLGCFRAGQRVDRLHGMLGFGDADEGAQSLLTQRERVVLKMIASGQTNSEIAAKLSFSTSTIRNDTSAIYRKLDVAGRAEAVARAIALGIVEIQRAEVSSDS
jgi:DNA-binding NarL/FixJ family response regulator